MKIHQLFLQVTTVNFRDGSNVPADMVLVGVGARPNTSLFEGQLTMEKGGIKVDGKMQSSNCSVYAIGDVAALPVKFLGESAGSSMLTLHESRLGMQ